MSNPTTTLNGLDSETMSRHQSTNDRRALAKRCRDELAAHIKQKTGLTIEPMRVRLVTKQGDAYTWAYTPEDAHLFSKNLGDHKVTAYKELCRKVGKTFYAVSRAKATNNIQPKSSGSRPTTTSLSDPNEPTGTSTVTHEDLVADAGHALYLMEERLMVEIANKERLQEELERVHVEYERLAHRFREHSERASQHESFLYRCLRTMSQMTTLAEEVKQDYTDALDVSVFPE